jgi:hypothetical protein
MRRFHPEPRATASGEGATFIVCVGAWGIAFTRVIGWVPGRSFPADAPALVLTAVAVVWAYYRAVSVIGRSDWFGFMFARFRAMPIMIAVGGTVFACGWSVSLLVGTAVQARAAAPNAPILGLAAMLSVCGIGFGWCAIAYGTLYSSAERLKQSRRDIVPRIPDEAKWPG